MDVIAKQVVEAERRRFRLYYDETLNFLREQNNIFVAGHMAADAFDTKQVNTEVATDRAQAIIVWTQDPYEVGVRLLKHVWKCVPKDTVYHHELILHPQLPGSVYNMQVPARQFASLRGLGEYRGKPFSALIRPPKIDGLNLMSPEVILINIYTDLFGLETADRNDLLSIENRFFSKFMADAEKGALVDGGREDEFRLETNGPLIARLRELVLAEFGVLDAPMKHSDGSWIIGKQAIEPDKDRSHLQILTACDDDKIKGRLNAAFDLWHKELQTKAIKALPPLKATPFFYPIALPGDRLLKRVRFFVEVGDKGRTQVLDLFTAPQYSLCAAHPYTIMRFILVDIWSLLIIRAMGEIEVSSMKTQIARNIALLKKARVAALAKDVDSLKESDFFGNYVDEKVLSRRTRFGDRSAPSTTVYGAVLAAKAAKN